MGTVAVEPEHASLRPSARFRELKAEHEPFSLYAQLKAARDTIVDKRILLKTLAKKILTDRSAPAKIFELQQTIDDAALRVKHLKSQIKSVDQPHYGADEEFAKIMALPQVHRAYVREDYGLVFVLMAQYHHNNKWYDMGDWEFAIGLPKDHTRGTGDAADFTCLLARETRKVGFRGGSTKYPSYAYSDNSFCFGSTNKPIISKHAAEGNFLHAVQIAVALLSSVNDDVDHIKKVPDAFEEIPHARF